MLAIIYGGPGNEHEVSIASAENVISALTTLPYAIQKIYIKKDMTCLVDGEEVTFNESLLRLTKETIVVPILHGSFGEGGVLQKILEDASIPYLFSNSSTSSVAMDKKRTQEILSESGLTVPKTEVVVSSDQEMEMTFPVFVKPNSEGSSIDLYKVENKEELHNILTMMLVKYNEVLVQEFVVGREFTCGVIEKKGELITLLPTEIILTKGELFDYDAKYKVGGCQEITPPHVSEEIIKRIQEIARVAHSTLKCKDISRTDMIMKEDGTIVVLEVNTIPGMTKTSFIPAQAVASGYTLSQIFDIVIHNHL